MNFPVRDNKVLLYCIVFLYKVISVLSAITATQSSKMFAVSPSGKLLMTMSHLKQVTWSCDTGHVTLVM